MELWEALQRIKELEQENSELRNELEKYKQYKTQGRKPHDEKWMSAYLVWKDLYEQGDTIVEIMEKTEISRRTYYRYKAYYEEQIEA